MKRLCKSGFPGGYHYLEKACMILKSTKERIKEGKRGELWCVCFKSHLPFWLPVIRQYGFDVIYITSYHKTLIQYMICASKSVSNLCDPKLWFSFLTYMLQSVMLINTRTTDLQRWTCPYMFIFLCIFNSSKR